MRMWFTKHMTVDMMKCEVRPSDRPFVRGRTIGYFDRVRCSGPSGEQTFRCTPTSNDIINNSGGTSRLIRLAARGDAEERSASFERQHTARWLASKWCPNGCRQASERVVNTFQTS